MNKVTESFVRDWREITLLWSEIAFGLSILILLYYFIVKSFKTKRTTKYQYISENEVRFFWYAALALSISVTFLINGSIIRVDNTSSQFVLGIKTFLSIAIGFAVAYFFSTYIHVYYPFRVEKKLHNIRFKPRFSPEGNEMKILTEKEEDVHLTQEMIHHENISAYEYDVWLDEKTGYKIIDKYKGKLHDLICENCNYRTLHEIREEVVEEPTATVAGKLIKEYKCTYCNHTEHRESSIAPLADN